MRQGGAPSSDRVIHIADVHFWQTVWNPRHLLNKRFFGNLTVLFRRRHDYVLARAEPYADYVASTGAACVVLTGDFCSTSTPAEFEMAARFMQGLRDRGLTAFVLPGNHDVYTFGAQRARRFEKYLGEFLPPQGYPALTALPGGTSLLLAPTVRPRHFSARGYISRQQLESMAMLLQKASGPILIAAHYPMLSRTHGYYSNPFRRLQNAERLRRILGESGKPILYLAGHVHRFSYLRDAEYPQLHHLTTGAFFRTDPDAAVQGEFTEVLVNTGFQIFRHLHKQTWKRTPVEPRA